MPSDCNGDAQKLIFACSGAADVGAIVDQAARKLSREGAGKMFCLVGVGGQVGGIMKTTKAAEKILAIDGCPLNCAKNCLEKAGFTEFAHLQIGDLGIQKGHSPITDKLVEDVAARGRELLV